MEGLFVHSSQSSPQGGRSGGGSSGGPSSGSMLSFGMDLSKSRTPVSVPKKRIVTSTTSTKSTSIKPSTSTSTLNSTSSPQTKSIPPVGMIRKPSKNPSASTSSSLKVKSKGKGVERINSYSNDAAGFFDNLEDSRREYERLSDKVEYRANNLKEASNLKSQDGRSAKSNDTHSYSKSSHIGKNDHKEYSSSSQNPRSQKSSLSRQPNNSQIQSISDDEDFDPLSLGSTPPGHKHDGYDDYKSQCSSPTKSPPSSNIKRPNKKKMILVPGSDDEEDNKPNLYQHNGLPKPTKYNKRDGPQVRGKKRSSEEEREVDIENHIKNVIKHRRRSNSNDLFELTPKPPSRYKPRRSDGSSSPNLSFDGHFGVDDLDILSQEKAEKVQQKKDEDQEVAKAFFDDLDRLSSEGEFDLDQTNEQIDITRILEEGMDDDEDLSPEDKAYLAPYKSQTELCPYCSAPFPANPSFNLLQHKEQLYHISTPNPTPNNPHARQLSWQKHIEFCALHNAETSVIPLGIKAGYPESIAFLDLDHRLESGWIEDRLNEIVANPHTSEIFVTINNEIREMGKSKWSSMKWQSRPENLQAVKPGYYGDLGRTIIIHHFFSLRKWGLLPTLKNCDPHHPPSLDPLGWTEFVQNVLVPEASILLIMSDQGKTKFSRQSYEKAKQLRMESVNYGTWRFREDDGDAQATLEILQDGKEEKKSRIKTAMRKQKKVKQQQNDSYESHDDHEGLKYKSGHEFQDDDGKSIPEERLESYESTTPKPKQQHESKPNIKKEIIEIIDSPNITPMKIKNDNNLKSITSTKSSKVDKYNKNNEVIPITSIDDDNDDGDDQMKSSQHTNYSEGWDENAYIEAAQMAP
ncbi:uncharacterized protein L201_002557 [Kwoniella dendrophila CBS 6074]|uniref:Restriction of telomere capping protein 4 n=1 Tax=Kwoniella dendrophila CBS 6074 TaxID=1295534 RepID=A0AAX4JRE0_9TREE